jgi:hypothetical protein
LSTDRQRCINLCTAIRPFQWFWLPNQPLMHDRWQPQASMVM